MSEGTVKWFRGSIGFIKPDAGGADVFVHITNINTRKRPPLTRGQRVSYELMNGPKGSQATNVTPFRNFARKKNRQPRHYITPQLDGTQAFEGCIDDYSPWRGGGIIRSYGRKILFCKTSFLDQKHTPVPGDKVQFNITMINGRPHASRIVVVKR